MATRSLNTDRNMGGGTTTTRPSMAQQSSGGVVKARQLVSSSEPFLENEWKTRRGVSLAIWRTP